MNNGIRVSEKHGVNPSMMVCFYCQETYAIALLGKLPGDAEAPRQAVYDRTPCPKCQEWMTKGVIMISVRDSDYGSSNPYRTGGWVVLTDDAVRRILRDPDDVLKARIAFVPDGVWDELGLPRGEA